MKRAFSTAIYSLAILFCGVCMGLALDMIPFHAQTDKAIAVKPEKTAIEFSASDAAKIARIQAGANAVCGDATQKSYVQINDIIKGYNPPEGWEIQLDSEKNWIGLRKPSPPAPAQMEKKP